MSVNLFEASQQWQTRPADQRFESLESLYAYCQAMRDNAAQSVVSMNRLRAEPAGAELALIGETGQRASLTHWSFGQLANRIGAPAELFSRILQLFFPLYRTAQTLRTTPRAAAIVQGACRRNATCQVTASTRQTQIDPFNFLHESEIFSTANDFGRDEGRGVRGEGKEAANNIKIVANL